MVARKFIRLAEAVAVELDGASESVESLSQASDEMLLRASERCGLLLAPQFHRSADRLAAIRRRLDNVRDAESSEKWSGAEDEDAAIRRRLRAIAYRDTTDMSPTDRRTTAEALRTLAVLNRASRRRGDREKSAIVQRPPEFNREPVMCWRSILPAGPTPQALAERAVLAERSRPAQTFEERLRQQAFADQARMRAQYERKAAEAIRWAARCAAQATHYRPEDTPRRIGMPGIGGM
jgi:hypothetical protein